MPGGAPAQIVVLDSNGNIIAVGDVADSAVRVKVISGGGGGSVTQGTVPWIVDGSGVTQPVSAVALPLPANAAQEAGGNLASLNSKVTVCNTGAVVLSSGTLTGITNPVAVTQSGAWSAGRTWTLSSGTDSVAVSGSVSISGSVAVTQSGAWQVDVLTMPVVAVTQSGVWSVNAQAVAEEVAPAHDEGSTADLSVTLQGFLRTLSGALVGDTSPSYAVGQQQPLSMTNDGRLRVAVADARVGPEMFNEALEGLWGNFKNDITFTSSPWEAW